MQFTKSIKYKIVFALVILFTNQTFSQQEIQIVENISLTIKDISIDKGRGGKNRERR